jgi:hypothetical protein
MKIKYKDIVLRNSSKILVEKCNEIIEEYATQGFTLTLRQLYYQLVSRGIIPNSQKSYKRVGSIVNDARLGGYIDWQAIEDRTRNLRGLAHWENPADIVESVSLQFRVDLWEGQTYRPEVWIEKDALVGVIEGVCNQYDVPFFSCRGYTSQSEMWGAAQRLKNHALGGQIPYILHFGDHDPSGKDMTRDIGERLSMFIGDGAVELHRMALNMDQIKKYDPPPNPAKQTDSRYEAYIREFGDESWELDALEPRVIAALISTRIDSLIDKKPWNEQKKKIKEGRATLALISARFPDVETFLEDAA